MLVVALSTAAPRTETIDGYVVALSRALRGPRRLRADLVAEARDGLEDATEAYEADGLDRVEAEREAVQEFGEVSEIAAAYRDELAIAQARRTAVLLSVATLIQPLVWADGVWPWNSATADTPSPVAAVLNTAIEGIGMVVILGAVFAVAACGIGTRFATARRYAAGTTAAFSLLSCVLLPMVGIALAVSGAHSLAAVSVALMWLAIFVLGPLAAVAVSATRCLTIAR
jgi:HAAS domain-containing protein